MIYQGWFKKRIQFFDTYKTFINFQKHVSEDFFEIHIQRTKKSELSNDIHKVTFRTFFKEDDTRSELAKVGTTANSQGAAGNNE